MKYLIALIFLASCGKENTSSTAFEGESETTLYKCEQPIQFGEDLYTLKVDFEVTYFPEILTEDYAFKVHLLDTDGNTVMEDSEEGLEFIDFMIGNNLFMVTYANEELILEDTTDNSSVFITDTCEVQQ